MAMFYYNPKRKEKNCGDWKVCTETGKLVVTNNNTKETYIVDGFKDHTRYEFDGEDIWYSFDPSSGNFHIVPEGTIATVLH